ncbi:F-box/kelch-repeat protein At3g23880-like [Papaver somniferum]|uniref:F-box/kelch-repeat protein At3g23880-like n=1 Tax=Papaver somniferum TaxID=3469 RepID=UPI000E6F54EE|nr:F-box/kelch-repeat protein At3g23880-like [Papaver somniferum]
MGFIVSTCKNDKSHYFEYNENHEPSAPIQRIRRINSVPPFEESVIFGSCNGLLCFAQSPWFVEQTFNSVCICNPRTKEYVVVPEIKIDRADTFCWATGFGYISSTNEYKVVGVCQWRELDFVEVLVYTLGSGNVWRNLGKFNVGCNEAWGHSIFFNEALYWLDVGLQMIFVFDLAEEKFREHPPPPPLPTESNFLNNRIGVSDGFLFFTYCLIVRGITYYDTWLLRKKNDDHDMKENEEHQSLGCRCEEWKGFNLQG